MVDRLEALAELDRRGKLPEHLRPAFEEAKRRGLIPGAQEPNVGADVLQQVGERFNQGLYATINAPTSLANLAVSGINAASDAMGTPANIPEFRPPLEAVAPGVHEWFSEAPEAQTALGRVAGTVAEYAGANAVPGMGAIAVAPRVAKGTSMLAPMAQQIARSPGAAAAGEAVSTVGAGVGAQVARDAFPGDAGAEFLAATIGGVAAPAAVALSPANIARKGINAVRRRVSPEELSRQQREKIVEGVRQNITPEAEARINETVDIQNAIPGYRPSVAEATESPSFVQTQRDFEGGLSGPALDQAIARYSQNESAIRNAVRDQAPTATGDLDAAMMQGRQRRDRVLGGIRQADERLAERARQQAESLRPGARRRETGASLRNELTGERARIKEEMSITAREMGLNDPAAVFDFGRYKQRLIDSAAPRSRLEDQSALPSGILSDIRAMDDSASIVDLMALRSRIGQDIREAQRMPTGEKRVPYLQKLKSELDAVTDEMIRRSGDPELADRVQEFRRIYREDYVMPFEQGAADRVLSKDITGAFKIPDEQVAKEFFDGWNQTNADQFQRAFKSAPSAHVAMEAAALDDLYAHALRDGVLDPSLVASWSRKHSGVLSSFPRIQQRVGDIQSAVESVSRRRATLVDRQRQVERSFLARELARLDNPLANATPESIVDQAITNPTRMSALLRSIKGPEARAAISRQVWMRALEASDPVAFLNKHSDSIASALGASKYQAAMRLARAIEKSNLVPRPSGQALDTNPVAAIEGVLGTGLNQISSRVFAVKSGRTSARYALADLAGRAFRTMSSNSARKMLQDALYDPQVAVDLANAIGPGNTLTEAGAKRLFTFMISNGLVAFDERAESPVQPSS